MRVLFDTMGEPDPAFGPKLLDGAVASRELLERVARGDRDAFHAFYRCHGARVMAMVRRQVAAPSLAEELVQDVFVAAWFGARGYRGEMGDPERWLLGITRHKLQDHWRRVQALVKTMNAHVEDARHATRIVDTDLRLAIEEALAGLPLEQRRVLDLIYQNGLTFAETARALRVPQGTVKSRVHAALLTLRAIFGRQGPP
jgi:RNA polymerase sigma-70 factor (ECF subfamily)